VSLRDAGDEFESLGISIVGISPDAVKTQKKFDEKNRLGFPLLSDDTHVVSDAYGTWGEKTLYGRKYMGITRSVFLISETGVIQDFWYGISPLNTVPKVLASLKEK